MALDITATEIGRVILKFFRRQPLTQVAIAAAAWIPLTIALRLIVGVLGFENLIDGAVATWAIQTAAAGLGFLGASTFIALSNRVKATGRRKQRAEMRQRRTNLRAQEAAAKAEASAAGKKRRFDEVAEAIAALEDEDRLFLKQFVDAKRPWFKTSYLSAFRSSVSALTGADWIWVSDAYDSTVHLREDVFDFLLAHPELVGSEKRAIVIHDKLAASIAKYERGTS